MGDLSLMRFPLWLALPLSTTSPRCRTRVSLGRFCFPCRRSYWSCCAAHWPGQKISWRSGAGARCTMSSSAACCPSRQAFPVMTPSTMSSTPSTACCSLNASPPGSKTCASPLRPPPRPRSSPSTARPLGALTTAARTVGRCIWSRHGPAASASCSGNRHVRPSPMRSQPFRSFWNAWRSPARSSPSMPWGRRPGLPRPSSIVAVTICSRSRTTRPVYTTRSDVQQQVDVARLDPRPAGAWARIRRHVQHRVDAGELADQS